MVQSNSIGSTFETAFGIPSWVVGIVLVVICAIIFLGGVQRLASVTEKIVPVMAAIFLLGGLVGIGTLVCAFGLGPFIQFFNGAFSEKVLQYKPVETS